MKTDMQDLNDMKLMWQELNGRLDRLEAENKSLMKRVMQSDYRTGIEKLERKYSGFIWIESVIIIFVTLFFILNPVVNEKFRLIALIYWVIFFLMEIIIDSVLLFRLRKIDIYGSSIKEVARRAAANWKLHKAAIFTGAPLAIVAAILFALAINANAFTIYGMAAGGLIGTAIGIIQLNKIRNYYNLLRISE